MYCIYRILFCDDDDDDDIGTYKHNMQALGYRENDLIIFKYSISLFYFNNHPSNTYKGMPTHQNNNSSHF